MSFFFSSFTVVVDWSKSTTYLHSHNSISSKYDIIKWFPNICITLNNSLGNLLIRVQTCNNVSEFTHTNWITKSYHSSPKHKESACINTSLTSVHSNLEHGLVILTECFSPLRSVLHNLSCWSPKQKWCDKPYYSHFSCATTGENQFEVVWTSYNQLSSCRWSKADDDVRLPVVWPPGLEIPIIIDIS